MAEQIRNMLMGREYDVVKGSPAVEAVEDKYELNYAYGICEWLSTAFPEEFRRNFGSIEECVRAASEAGDMWFDKWKVNYPRGVITRIKLARELKY